MKRGMESQASGLEQILLFTVLIIAGLLPAVRSVWAEDDAPVPPSVAPAPAVPDSSYDVDQLHAQLRFLSVPTELVEATISDWILAPFEAEQLAAGDPFAVMNQPLQRPRSEPGDKPQGQVTAGTEMRIPSIHKVLNDQQARALLRELEADARTKMVFSPQLAFIDGTTATAVVGEKTPFIVGWKDDLPQTRVVSQGKMVRLRTVLDDGKIWLDYEVILSRIRDVASRSVRVANRPHPVVLAVPNVQTTTAGASTELPAGGTLLVGGLPAESADGVPRQLLVLIRLGRMRGIHMKKVASSDPQEIQRKAPVSVLEYLNLQEKPAEKPVAEPPPAEPKKRKPFSLISRILKRTPAEAVKPLNVYGGVK